MNKKQQVLFLKRNIVLQYDPSIGVQIQEFAEVQTRIVRCSKIDMEVKKFSTVSQVPQRCHKRHPITFSFLFILNINSRLLML